MNIIQQAIVADCETHDLPAPELEYRFCDRKWRFDAAWPAYSVAVEVHGGVWVSGHHTRGQGFIDDREKMNHAQIAGWIVLEFVTEQIMRAEYIDLLRVALATRNPRAILLALDETEG